MICFMCEKYCNLMGLVLLSSITRTFQSFLLTRSKVPEPDPLLSMSINQNTLISQKDTQYVIRHMYYN